jgi:hypothetical protein
VLLGFVDEQRLLAAVEATLGPDPSSSALLSQAERARNTHQHALRFTATAPAAGTGVVVSPFPELLPDLTDAPVSCTPVHYEPSETAAATSSGGVTLSDQAGVSTAAPYPPYVAALRPGALIAVRGRLSPPRTSLPAIGGGSRGWGGGELRVVRRPLRPLWRPF